VLLDRQNSNVAVERGHPIFEVVEFAHLIAPLLPGVNGARHATCLLCFGRRTRCNFQYFTERIADNEPRHRLALLSALCFAAALHVLTVSALVRLHIFEAALLVANRIELVAVFAAMSRSICHTEGLLRRIPGVL
jgi:hypothetical protein